MARTKEFDPDVAVIGGDRYVLGACGYANTSMQDLVDELGLNRGSIYGTFGSKHELFVAALTRYCELAPHHCSTHSPGRTAAPPAPVGARRPGRR